MIKLFYGCSSLQSIDLSNFDTSSVINMEYMFYECSALQTLTLSSKFVTTKVVNMEYMFYGCTTLQTLTQRQRVMNISLADVQHRGIIPRQNPHNRSRQSRPILSRNPD